MQDLSPQRWKQVEPLLEEALDLEPAEWQAFLEQACPDDPQLRRVVERLLNADADAGAFLEQPAGVWVAPLFEKERPAPAPPPPAPKGGTRVGPYRLVDEIGRGGMGVVYRAERVDGQFERQVALKLIAHPDTESVARRFRAERQILAQLQHPHIARLFDGGVTEEGQPYFVMEYVEGQPIDEYCDAHRLSVEERLQLFVTVVEAVQHAHQNLVVHRDLKPSNVLVDPEGRVKLLDFGIAKLLTPDGEGTATRTGVGGPMMTPAYAAPEQVRGDPVSTVTDVHQLGVLAYELLSGHRPHRFETDAPLEIGRTICEEIPDPPSRAVGQDVSRTRPGSSTEPIPASDVSRARATNPSTLRRRLRGDLDAVVMKALRKDPEARYSSAGALADDLERHLASRPVEARAPAAGYRLRKFLHRHRWGAAVTAAFAALVIGFSILYTTRVSAERNRAQREAQKAERVSEFLADLFVASNPFEEVQGDTLEARDLLNRGAERINAELDDEPEVQATMMQIIGEVYQNLGEYDRARSLMTRAHERWREIADEPTPEIAENLRLRSALRHDQGDYAVAESLGRAALTIDRELYGRNHPRVADDLFLMGLARQEQGDYAVAESLHHRALTIRREGLEQESLPVARSVGELERALAAQGDYATAESLQHVALDLNRRIYGETHPRVAQELNDVAYLARQQGKYEKAETYYRDAIDIMRETLGPSHPELANPLNNLGILLGVQGRYEEAEPFFRKALSIRRGHHGNDHPSVANSLHSLGRLMLEMGKLDSARVFAEEALAAEKKAVGEVHEDVAVKLDLLGRIHAERGDYARAERYYREALSIERQVRGGEHPRIATEMNNLASVLIEQDRHAEAESLLRTALEMDRQLFDSEHPQTSYVMRTLGRLLGRTGRYAEGETLLLKALSIQKGTLGQEHPTLTETIKSLVALYDAWGKPERAAAYRDTLAALGS